MTYGFVRATSWNCRLIVGRALISFSDSDSVEPIRSGLMSGAVSAVTTMASVTASRSSGNDSCRVSPRATLTSFWVWGRKPLMVAVIV